jgi:hypothetical protein
LPFVPSAKIKLEKLHNLLPGWAGECLKGEGICQSVPQPETTSSNRRQSGDLATPKQSFRFVKARSQGRSRVLER